MFNIARVANNETQWDNVRRCIWVKWGNVWGYYETCVWFILHSAWGCNNIIKLLSKHVLKI